MFQRSKFIKPNLADFLFPSSLSTLHDLHFRFQIYLREKFADCDNFLIEEIGDVLNKMVRKSYSVLLESDENSISVPWLRWCRIKI